MRRIYDSDALSRDDDDPFTPTERDERSRSAIDWEAASHAFLPTWVRTRAVSVSVETNARSYARSEDVHWRVTFRNRLPFPVRLVTETPELWRWSIDGIDHATTIDRAIPDRKSAITFSRSERKVFERRWTPRIRMSESLWEPLEPGEHTLSVALNVENAAERGLADETTFTIEE